ncbi:hypothetical protein ACFVSS_04310 [Peribacillus butanolivorans]
MQHSFTVLFGADKKGETDNRDSLFQKIFGNPFPGTNEGEQGGVVG